MIETEPWTCPTSTVSTPYAPVFDHALARNARSLIVFMALAFAGAPSIAFYRTRSPLGAHALFSLHVYAFLLLLFCVGTVVPPIDLWFGGAGFASDGLDNVISIALLLACGVYLHVATGAVYGANGATRVLKVVALTVAVASIVLGYRFVLLLITLYTT